MDDKAAKEQDEFDTAREKHDKALTNWTTNPGNKEKRNVRTLLSTMHVRGGKKGIIVRF